MKSLLLLFLLFVLTSASLLAGDDKPDYGFTSVLATTDQRSYSFGNLVAAGNDWNSYYWNPALIGRKRGYGFNYEFDDLYHGIDFHAWTFGYNHTRFGSVALFYRKFDFGRIEITTVDQPEGNGEFFSPYEAIYGISYAKSIKQITAGITIKRLYSKIDKISASAYTLDFGALTRRTVKLINMDNISEEVTIALSASDMLVSKKPKYGPSRLMVIDSTGTRFVAVSSEPFSIPQSFRAGGTYSVTFSSDDQNFGSDKPMSVTLNAAYWNIPIRPKDHFSIGLECVLYDILSVSTSTKNLARKNSENFIGNRLGAGLMLSTKRLFRTKYDAVFRLQIAYIHWQWHELASPITAGVEYRY